MQEYDIKTLDVKTVMNAAQRKYPNINWDEEVRLVLPTHTDPRIMVNGQLTKSSNERTNEKTKRFSMKVHPIHSTVIDKQIDEQETAIGETLYQLHFFEQIPIVGRYISGLTALFFLFATITGVLIHWKNLASKFWSFSLADLPKYRTFDASSLKNGWKRIWSNAHTVFGLLGLPFQLMYAVTGAFYTLLVLILLPSVLIFYNGDSQKVLHQVLPSPQYDSTSAYKDNSRELQAALAHVQTTYSDHSVYIIRLKHFYRQDASASIHLKSHDEQSFDRLGFVIVRLAEGTLLAESLPGKNKTYVQSVINGIGTLHFANYGGILLKSAYFCMALFTCFVIVSGILLWREARKTKDYTPQQQQFHQRVTTAYLALCFGLFPAIPTLFAAELLIPRGIHYFHHVSWVNAVFFAAWFVFCVVGVLLQSERRMLQWYLRYGGLIALTVPLVNGTMTGDWLWQTIARGQWYVVGTDMFWLLVGILTLWIQAFMGNTDNVIPSDAFNTVPTNEYQMIKG
jgi:uncharacterized iron-regulated membrane protein